MLGSFQSIIYNADEIITESAGFIYFHIRRLNEGINLSQCYVCDNLIEIYQPLDHEKVLQINFNTNKTEDALYVFGKNAGKDSNQIAETKLYRTDIYTAYFIKFKLDYSSKKFNDVLQMKYTNPTTVSLDTIKDIKKYDHIINIMDKLTSNISAISRDNLPSVV
jgi:hypothetical protein